MSPAASVFSQEHELFRKTVSAFIEREIAPHYEDWEKAGQATREVWRKAGEAGLLLTDIPEDSIGVSNLPEPPEGMEIARVDVVVRLRRKKG